MLRISPRNTAAKIQNISIKLLFGTKKTALLEGGLVLVVVQSFYSKTIDKSIFSKRHAPYAPPLLTINEVTNTTKQNMLQITIHLL